MRRQSYQVRALVVRTHDFGEADRIVVLLTREQGLVRAVAKGVRRAKSRFGARIQPFVELVVQLYPGRNLDTITTADTREFFSGGIIGDLERYAAASAVLESVERLTLEHAGHASAEDAAQLYGNVLLALRRIATEEHPRLSLLAYLLQAMGDAGWAPSLFECAQCARSGPHHAFHPAPGGAVCVMCRPPGAVEVDPESLHIMWLLSQDAMAAAAELLTPTREVQVDRLVRSYMQWHVERKLASLNVLDQA